MSIRRLIPLALVMVATVLFAPAPAAAQYSYYNSGSFMFNQNNYPDVTGATFRARQANSKPSSQQTTTRKPVSQITRSSAALAMNNALPYTRDRALSNDIRSEFLVDLAGRGSVSDVSQMAKMMAKYDFVQVFAGMARLQGLNSGTPEGLTALFYGQAWAIANKQPLPPAHQYQAIAKQLRNTNARAKVWDTLDNRGRQKLVETLAYPIIVQKANYEAYRREGRADAVADMAARVQAGMKNFKMDMQATKLTDAGFDRLP